MKKFEIAFTIYQDGYLVIEAEDENEVEVIYNNMTIAELRTKTENWIETKSFTRDIGIDEIEE
ncbi:hypothetical protein [Neobacillus sp. DY30]|uniref:hypothetical protein n=1 Tax=Neobacillus sp. DY30 TaxID=3047871 RepID=UPI0024BF8310|nr:hypothetical protein [Neobacillus sp. DY30]WHY01359.1 hypothetical protein QNH29_03650 [Neobacillus sp. DY30]